VCKLWRCPRCLESDIPLEHKDEHLINCKAWRCQRCWTIFPSEKRDEHLKECNKFGRCSYCGQSHRTAKCKFWRCGRCLKPKIPQEQRNMHLMRECKFWKCGRCSTTKIPREQRHIHLENCQFWYCPNCPKKKTIFNTRNDTSILKNVTFGDVIVVACRFFATKRIYI
jgi:hypothetical protein